MDEGTPAKGRKLQLGKNLVPDPLDREEPEGLAETIKKLSLKHSVITSVARDDLADGGARFWATCIRTIRQLNPDTTLEVLIPDFDGEPEHLQPASHLHKVHEFVKPEVFDY